MTCTCGHIMLGLVRTEHRSWNPYCPEHGTKSEWWNSEEQKAQRKEDRVRRAELMRRARMKRQVRR